MLKSGGEAGVGMFVVQSVATVSRQVQSINDFIHAACQEHPDRLIGFGTIHPGLENPVDEIERCVKLGLHGIKIHPDVQRFHMDDPSMYPIYEAIEGRLPILIHCGDYRYDFSHPRRLAHILDDFPKLEVIGAHFDTSSSFAFLGKVRSKEIIRAYGADRLLFGDDFPMWDHKTEVETLLSLDLTDDEYEKIFSGNAKRLLRMTPNP